MKFKVDLLVLGKSEIKINKSEMTKLITLKFLRKLNLEAKKNLIYDYDGYNLAEEGKEKYDNCSIETIEQDENSITYHVPFIAYINKTIEVFELVDKAKIIEMVKETSDCSDITFIDYCGTLHLDTIEDSKVELL